MSMLLGLDLGERRIGTALAQEALSVATAHKTFTINGKRDIAAAVKQLAEEYEIKKVVVGLPKTLKGDHGPAAEKVLNLVDWLKQEIDIEWILWDERLSTKEVDRVLTEASVSHKKKKSVRDSLAAQRILQSFLDFRR